ncbi:MAG: tetratricopeptide repeat protein, partial [Sulfitobacter sp.]
MDLLNFLEDWPYIFWSVSAAFAFYHVTAFATSDLPPDKKAALTLWLEGSYESTWFAQFCNAFDRIFGENHLSIRCFARSTLASFVAVIALWVLFDPILGLISLRADTSLSLTQALLLGAAINIIPDYLSLYETRWLLKLFERIRNPIGQLAILIVDAAVSGIIIYFGIKVFLWVSDAPTTSLIEMIAIFSVYSLFFYSTFLTSIWAWGYCLSAWPYRLSASLRNWRDLNEAPGRALALVGAIFVLIGTWVGQPLLTMNEEGGIPLDEFLCSAFPSSACTHVARLTNDELKKLEFLGKACLGGITIECANTAFAIQEIKPAEASLLWAKACDKGDATSCSNLGIMYQNGVGVGQDEARAAELYQVACTVGNIAGCSNLGIMYQNGIGVGQDEARAAELYQMAC